jgi:glutathione S-transferase
MFYKGIDFEIKYVDLRNKPEWFLQISPFGKVPVLQIGDKGTK